ncbi:hypothetical protein FOL47_007238 [Perkinsus chesapeaki]|uniref:Uncharacterized protein n=1 Tax=Perkinsus chesapeaki TaxID=330153 RepID=A0A7J6MW07_PERCH|nr:hypothetical protein FOL47_007238 [Perkinsus chesapeaki]
MRLSSTLLVFATQAVLSVMAQIPGRYQYSEGDEYILAIDISDHGHSYELNFDGTFDGVHRLYIGIQSIYPGIKFQDGDLTTVTFITADRLYVMFGGKKVELSRVAYDLQVGKFVYMEGELPFPNFRISYNVHSDGGLEVTFVCADIATPTGIFTIVENDLSKYKYKSYDLIPFGNIDKLKRDIRHACPGLPLYPEDLKDIIFVNSYTIFIGLGNTRYTLTKA